MWLNCLSWPPWTSNSTARQGPHLFSCARDGTEKDGASGGCHLFLSLLSASSNLNFLNKLICAHELKNHWTSCALDSKLPEAVSWLQSFSIVKWKLGWRLLRVPTLTPAWFGQWGIYLPVLLHCHFLETGSPCGICHQCQSETANSWATKTKHTHNYGHGPKKSLCRSQGRLCRCPPPSWMILFHSFTYPWASGSGCGEFTPKTKLKTGVWVKVFLHLPRFKDYVKKK